MSLIPAPPDLKPTIIQMQNNDQSNDIESVDPKFSPNVAPNDTSANNSTQPKRKRRRSSASLISQNEIEKRRREHKTAHSIIEKKRRIRMNREFEALKFMIPACRNNLTTSNNSGEGMYKLTILQATVDYIKYLHNVINIQNDEILKLNPEFDEDLEFASIDVDTEAYRNLDNDFDFGKLFDSYSRNNSDAASSSSSSSSSLTNATNNSSTPLAPKSMRRGRKTDPLSNASKQQQYLEPTKFEPLPSPLITPELFPKQTPSSTPLANYKTINPDFQFHIAQRSQQHPPNCTSAQSPATIASNSSSAGSSRDFQLPKAALSNSVSVGPDSKLGIINELSASGSGLEHETSASNVLLSMKRDSSVASIRSLLN